MSYFIGIDLGTTNTVVAAVVDGMARTLADDEGSYLIPSVVSFHPGGEVLVGREAKERLLVDPENTIYSAKRLIGRPFSSDDTTAAAARLPFKLVAGARDVTMVETRGEQYAVSEISAFVLRRAKALAEHVFEHPVQGAVITVPASFNDLQRAATKIAAKVAGLTVLRIMNEPTAAALAYGQGADVREKIVVYDFGGGTFDVTVLDLAGGVFEVLATGGDTALGGDDVDAILSDVLAEGFLRATQVDPRTDGVARGRLKRIAEDLKIKLSTETEALVTLDGLGYGRGGEPLSVPMRMTRERFLEIIAPIVARTVDATKQVVDKAGLSLAEVDRVLMVGGSTRIPAIDRAVADVFGKPPSRDVNPDEVVALGAAIQANALGGGRAAREAMKKGSEPPKKRPLSRQPPPVAPASPAPSRSGEIPALPLVTPDTPRRPPPVPRAAPSAPSAAAAPAAATPAAVAFERSAPSLTFELEGLGLSPPGAVAPREGGLAPVDVDVDLDVEAAEPSPGPMLAPASAAELLAGHAIATRMHAPLLIDVTPLSLRIETVGGYSEVLVAANSPVPCDKTRSFFTAADMQTTVVVRVAQGEHATFAENTFLGELELSGLRAAPRGTVKIAVTFELDADGILNVRARDEGSGNETRATMRLVGADNDVDAIMAMTERQESSLMRGT